MVDKGYSLILLSKSPLIHSIHEFFPPRPLHPQFARAHRRGGLRCVRQQIQKTKAHLTGAVVPSSDERWNHSKKPVLLAPILAHRASVERFYIGHFYLKE